VAGFASPPFDSDDIPPLFVLGFALVISMPDETAFSSTLRAALRTITILVFLLLDIPLFIASIID
jgi:hypothetical protein